MPLSSPLRLPTFASGNGSLVPFDGSRAFVTLAILFLRSLPIACWFYLAIYSLVPSPTITACLPTLLKGKWLKFMAKYITLPWSIIEVCFSLYHAYLVKKIQGPGPRPLYSRRFLRKVFARALKSGLGLDNLVEANNLEKERVEQLLRQDYADSATKSNSISHSRNPTNSFSATKHDDDPDADDPEAWFATNALSPYDPRARKFQWEQAQWFHLDAESKKDSTRIITRRDVSHWLAWSLFTTSLEELEEEHAQMLRKAKTDEGHDDAGRFDGPSSTTYSEEEVKGGVTAEQADEEDPSLRKVLAEQGEWSHADADGTRLDFLRKARRMLEARQGLRYPLKRGGGPGPTQEINGEGGTEGDAPTRSMRLTLDPVAVQARPFVVYCVTQALSRLTLYKATHSQGFVLRTSGRLSYLVRIPSSWSPAKASDPSTKGRYRPTIFLHGLGIGLAQYHALIDELVDSVLAETHPIMIPLQPHTSQNIFSPHFLKPVGHHEMITCLRRAMRLHEFSGEVQVLSHSMGTIVHAWLLKSLGDRVARSCFVDPIPFRLYIPDVCGNFLYFRADTPIKQLLRYFVGREIGTANTLSRYFDWSSNILWPEDEIPRLTSAHHTRFFLAGQDVILNCRETREYLLEYGVKEEIHVDGMRSRGGLIVDWGAAHGELLMKDGKGMREIMRWLVEEDG